MTWMACYTSQMPKENACALLYVYNIHHERAINHFNLARVDAIIYGSPKVQKTCIIVSQLFFLKGSRFDFFSLYLLFIHLFIFNLGSTSKRNSSEWRKTHDLVILKNHLNKQL